MTNNIMIKNEDTQKALIFFKQKLSLYPNEASSHINLSNVYVSLGEIELAMQHLHQALRLQPNDIAAYNNLGRLLYKQGRIPDAIPYFEKALRIDPNYWEAHYNLGHSLSSQNLMNQAAAHYAQVIRLIPTHATAHFNLGLIYFEASDFSLAKKHLEEALVLDPNNIEAARILGQAYTHLGSILDAIKTYQKALVLSPTLADVHHNLAILLLREKDRSAALVHFKAAVELDPDNQTSKHMILSLTGTESCESPPQDYIKHLFDQYADHYDAHLKLSLKYQVPGLLRNAVGRCLGSNPKTGRVLDLGCGTGQAGVTFRDLALELIGVDLSPNMIEKAKQLSTYEKLLVTDLNEFLANSSDHYFDTIVAADVLVYCGALENIFKDVKRTLSLNGLFAFTIETQGFEQYQLQPTGRFSHSDPYIHALAEKFHLTILIQETVHLREHEGIPVIGSLYVLRSKNDV